MSSGATEEFRAATAEVLEEQEEEEMGERQRRAFRRHRFVPQSRLALAASVPTVAPSIAASERLLRQADLVVADASVRPVGATMLQVGTGGMTASIDSLLRRVGLRQRPTEEDRNEFASARSAHIPHTAKQVAAKQQRVVLRGGPSETDVDVRDWQIRVVTQRALSVGAVAFGVVYFLDPGALLTALGLPAQFVADYGLAQLGLTAVLTVRDVIREVGERGVLAGGALGVARTVTTRLLVGWLLGPLGSASDVGMAAVEALGPAAGVASRGALGQVVIRLTTIAVGGALRFVTELVSLKLFGLEGAQAEIDKRTRVARVLADRYHRSFSQLTLLDKLYYGSDPSYARHALSNQADEVWDYLNATSHGWIRRRDPRTDSLASAFAWKLLAAGVVGGLALALYNDCTRALALASRLGVDDPRLLAAGASNAWRLLVLPLAARWLTANVLGGGARLLRADRLLKLVVPAGSLGDAPLVASVREYLYGAERARERWRVTYQEAAQWLFGTVSTVAIEETLRNNVSLGDALAALADPLGTANRALERVQATASSLLETDRSDLIRWAFLARDGLLGPPAPPPPLSAEEIADFDALSRTNPDVVQRMMRDVENRPLWAADLERLRLERRALTQLRELRDQSAAAVVPVLQRADAWGAQLGRAEELLAEKSPFRAIEAGGFDSDAELAATEERWIEARLAEQGSLLGQARAFVLESLGRSAMGARASAAYDQVLAGVARKIAEERAALAAYVSPFADRIEAMAARDLRLEAWQVDLDRAGSDWMRRAEEYYERQQNVGDETAFPRLAIADGSPSAVYDRIAELTQGYEARRADLLRRLDLWRTDRLAFELSEYPEFVDDDDLQRLYELRLRSDDGHEFAAAISAARASIAAGTSGRGSALSPREIGDEMRPVQRQLERELEREASELRDARDWRLDEATGAVVVPAADEFSLWQQLLGRLGLASEVTRTQMTPERRLQILDNLERVVELKARAQSLRSWVNVSGDEVGLRALEVLALPELSELLDEARGRLSRYVGELGAAIRGRGTELGRFEACAANELDEFDASTGAPRAGREACLMRPMGFDMLRAALAPREASPFAPGGLLDVKARVVQAAEEEVGRRTIAAIERLGVDTVHDFIPMVTALIRLGDTQMADGSRTSLESLIANKEALDRWATEQSTEPLPFFLLWLSSLACGRADVGTAVGAASSEACAAFREGSAGEWTSVRDVLYAAGPERIREPGGATAYALSTAFDGRVTAQNYDQTMRMLPTTAAAPLFYGSVDSSRTRRYYDDYLTASLASPEAPIDVAFTQYALATRLPREQAEGLETLPDLVHWLRYSASGQRFAPVAPGAYERAFAFAAQVMQETTRRAVAAVGQRLPTLPVPSVTTPLVQFLAGVGAAAAVVSRARNVNLGLVRGVRRTAEVLLRLTALGLGGARVGARSLATSSGLASALASFGTLFPVIGTVAGGVAVALNLATGLLVLNAYGLGFAARLLRLAAWLVAPPPTLTPVASAASEPTTSESSS